MIRKSALMFSIVPDHTPGPVAVPSKGKVRLSLVTPEEKEAILAASTKEDRALRILIVDDHDIVRQGVRVILRSRAQWEVCGEAENGIEALEKIAELKPDIVVLDVSMPYKDGLAVARELVQMNAPCKTVMLTMHNSTEIASAVRRTGAQGFVVKSHAAKDLVRAIETILGGNNFFAIDPMLAVHQSPAPQEASQPEASEPVNSDGK
jgi:DNA-binding NarL/FixJ family response regulator